MDSATGPKGEEMTIELKERPAMESSSRNGHKGDGSANTQGESAPSGILFKPLNFRRINYEFRVPTRTQIEHATKSFLETGGKITILPPGPTKLFSQYELDFWSSQNQLGVF